MSKIDACFELIHKNNVRLHTQPQKGFNLGSTIDKGILKHNHFSREEKMNIVEDECKSKSSEESIAACLWFKLYTFVSARKKLN